MWTEDFHLESLNKYTASLLVTAIFTFNCSEKLTVKIIASKYFPECPDVRDMIYQANESVNLYKIMKPTAIARG